MEACISYGCAGCATGAYAFELVDLPGAVFQGNVFAQNVNQQGFRWDLSPSNAILDPRTDLPHNQGAGAIGLPGEFKLGGWLIRHPSRYQ